MIPGRPPAELPGQPPPDGTGQQLGLADVLPGGVEEPPALGQPALRLGDGQVQAEQFRGGLTEHAELGSELFGQPGIHRGQALLDGLPPPLAPRLRGRHGERGQPFAAPPLDLARRGLAQRAAEQLVELSADLAGQPRPVFLGGVVEREQQPAGLGVDHGHGVAAVHGDLGQPLAEPPHPVGRVPGPHPGHPAGYRHLVQQGPGDPPGLRDRRRLQVGFPPGRQVRGEVGLERGEPRIGVAEGGTRRHRVHRARMARLAEHPLGELQRLGQPRLIEVIGLVQHHERPHRQPGDLLEQVSLAGRHRRVGGQHEHRRVHRPQRLMGRLRVPFEHRPGARGIDQLHPVRQQGCGDVHGHARDPAAVAGISPLGHQIREHGQGMLLVVPVEKPHLCPLVVAVPDGRRDGGQRSHPGRQHVPAQQRVDQRALASLGLADHQDPQPCRIQPVQQRRQLLPVPIRPQRGQLAQRADQCALAARHRRHPPTRVT